MGATITLTDFIWKVRRHVGSDDCRFLEILLGNHVRQGAINELLDELESSRDLAHPGDTRELPVHPARLDLNRADRSRGLLLYVSVRLLRPDTVIETGCFTGRDSATVLQALDRNRAGHLYTIDLPAVEGRFSQIGSGQSLPKGVPIGYLIPESLKHRWTLIVGDVRDELLALLQRVREVGVFYHDSHHSYDHMMWEYTTVWPFLKSGGLLVSDDIAWNTAFRDFARGVGRRIAIHRSSANLGALLR